jgi:peptide/nickel transport system substrate-binding protein
MPPKLLVFLGLGAVNDKGKLVGRLAERWDHSEDYRTWTLYLRKNIRWHDGVPVTAHDIKFTIDLWKHPDVMFYAGLPIHSAEVLDDYTCTITFDKPPTFEYNWMPGNWNVFYPKHLLKDLDPKDFDNWDFWTHPIGNGPFRFIRHVPHTIVELEANPDFYLGKPKIERLIIKLGSRVSDLTESLSGMGLTELLSGNVDAINYLPLADVAKLSKDPRFRIYYEIWDDIGFPQVILWNQNNPLFKDRKTRQALTLAINREEIPKILNMASNIPIIDTLYTERQYWMGELPEPYPFDTERSKMLLEEAGWEDKDGNSILERDGKEFRFTTLVRKKWESAAICVQSNLRKVGIRMEILAVKHELLQERLFNGNFDAAIDYIWTGTTGSMVNVKKLIGKDSLLGFDNDRVVELLATSENTMIPDERDAAYRQIMPIIQEEQPWTYLVLNVITYVAHRRVKGLSTPFRANPVWNAEFLWIEEDQK